MRALVHVTDLVNGVTLDLSGATLEPVLPGFLRLSVPEGTVVGSEVCVVVKATVQTIIPG